MYSEETKTENQSFDREAWLKQKQDERNLAFRIVEDTLGSIRKDEKMLQTYLDVQSRFSRYSVSNAVLVAGQKPQATRLGDFNYWKEAGEYVKKGELGILILEPGKEYTRKDGSIGVNYNTKKVFDISQTNAQPQESPEISRDNRLLMKALVSNAPCEIKAQADLADTENTLAYYDASDKTLYVAKGHFYEELFPSVAREIAHAYMDKDGYDRTVGENIAYCAAYIICKRSGIDAAGFRFDKVTEAFSSMDDKSIKAELGRIRDAANSICADMDRMFGKQEKDRSRDDAR